VSTVEPVADPRSVRAVLGRQVVDAALVFGLVALALMWIWWAPREPEYRDTDVVAVGLAVVSGASMVWRRSRPLVAFAAACVAVVVNAALGYAIGAMQYPVWLGLHSALAHSPRRGSRVGVVVGAVATVGGYALLDRGTVDINIAIGIGVFFALAVLGGEIARSRRALAEAERSRLMLHAQQEASIRERTALQERARLARELHDALGHAVNVMVMQAGVGRHVFDERPDFARAALAQIETVGRDALVELDSVLQMLRSDDDPHAERSTPSLAGLDALCDRIRATGRPVELRVGDVSLSPSGERAAYRIVQEAITNAARHSSDGPIEVSILPEGNYAVVIVHNCGTGFGAPTSGRGHLTMRERARLEGGDLECGPTEDGFVVRATLPTIGAGTR
jgi:signal transduction histidine kinase